MPLLESSVFYGFINIQKAQSIYSHKIERKKHWKLFSGCIEQTQERKRMKTCELDVWFLKPVKRLERNTKDCEHYLFFFVPFLILISFFLFFQNGSKAITASLVDQTFPIFKPPYLLKFIACSLMHFGTFAIGGGMGSFLPDTLNRLQKSRELDSSSDLRICELLKVDYLLRPSNESNSVNVVSLYAARTAWGNLEKLNW